MRVYGGGFDFGQVADGVPSGATLPKILLGKRVVGCGIGTIPPGTRAHDGESHRHPQAEVFVISAGEVHVPECADGPSIGPGQWIYVPPDVEHHLTTPAHSGCTALWLLLEDL